MGVLERKKEGSQKTVLRWMRGRNVEGENGEEGKIERPVCAYGNSKSKGKKRWDGIKCFEGIAFGIYIPAKCYLG